MTDSGRRPWPASADAPTLVDLERDGPAAARLVLAIPGDSPWLDGHFPDRPVLPGVVQLRWAIEAAGRLWPDLDTVSGVTSLKFSRPILPPAETTLHLDLDAPRRRLAFHYVRGEETCSSGRVRFA